MKTLAPSLASLALLIAGCFGQSEVGLANPGDLIPTPKLALPFPEAFDDFVIGVKFAKYELVLPNSRWTTLVVEFVRSGSLAEKAGMRVGDAVTHWMISVLDNTTKTSSSYGYEFSTKTRLAAFYKTAREMKGATSFSLGFFRDSREWKEVEFPIEALKTEPLPDDLPEG